MSSPREPLEKRYPAASRMFFLFATVLIISISASCGTGGSGKTPPQKKPPLVEVETVTRGPIIRAIDLTGEVIPIESIRISAMVDGPIGFCPWREGDSVEAGDKLIEIDREVYRAEAKAAEAALMVAQAKLADLNAGTRPEEIEKARQSVREAQQTAAYEKGDFQRTSKLVDNGILPKDDLEKARVKLTAAESKLNAARQQFEMLETGFTLTAIDVQKAAVKEAEAKFELAQARLSECLIAAPFAGTITKVFVRQGDMAMAKSPLLEMADLESLVIRCAVPEAQAGGVRQGMKAKVQIDALPGEVLLAEVARVFPELDPQMRTRTIELLVQDDFQLAPNMFGRVYLIIESFADVIAVPVQAVLATPAGFEVAFVVVDGKAIQRKVQTGIEEAGRIQILSGLNAGEKVILSGQEKLKDGAEIRLPGPPKNPQTTGKQPPGGELSQ